MATRDVIEKKINEISDGGNNSAAEIRSVLTDLLDYTENEPAAGSNAEFFHFWTDQDPVMDKLQNTLWYSLKGVENQWINFTFNIVINRTPLAEGTESSSNIFAFLIQDQDLRMVEYLKRILILEQPTLRFVIPYTTNISEQIIDYPLSTSIYFTEKYIVFDFNNNTFRDNNVEKRIERGSAFSSVSFHCPEFKFRMR